MARRLIISLMMLAAATATATVTALPASAQAQPSGHCVLKITRFAFRPGHVHAGQRTKLGLRAMNCTGRTLHLTEVQYGEQIPPCPTVDPIGGPVRLGPHARYAPKPLVMIAPDCNGVEVMVVRFSDQDGTVLAHRTATLHIKSP